MRKIAENTTLFVGGISTTVKKMELEKLFASCGKVAHIEMNKKPCKDGFNYCFIEMSSALEAKKCLETLSNTEFNGEKIFIRF